MNTLDIIKSNINNTIKETNYNIGPKYKGKVRDVYDLGDKLFIRNHTAFVHRLLTVGN